MPSLNEEASVMLAGDSIVIGISFAIFGSLPLLVEVLCSRLKMEFFRRFEITVAVSLVMLALLNLLKTYGSSKSFYCLLEGILFGLVCSGAAYYIGYVLGSIVEV